ncbi:MAG: hypothetical protein KC468_33050 [Myxococcales bacterium]|nr:hypothetical protein [Myxococcales bacterium]
MTTPSHYLVKQAEDGAPIWTREFQATWSDCLGLQAFGTSGLVNLDERRLLHVETNTGATGIWASERLSSPTEVSVTGDAAQVVVGWTEERLTPRPLLQLELAAFEHGVDARAWTVVESLEAGARLRMRLAERWVLIHQEWVPDMTLIRRSDGHLVSLDVDTPGLCRAAGRWWGRRDDRLFTLELTGDVPRERSTRVAFFDEEDRSPWSLVDCATRGDEVVLMVSSAGDGGGALVGLEPTSMRPRWRLPLPYVPLPAAGVETFGDIAIVRQDEQQCAIDLERRQLLWCNGAVDVQAIADGEDTILCTDPSDTCICARIDGDTGEFEAAARVCADLEALTSGAAVREHAGRLWLTGDDRLAEGPPALVVFDVHTMRRVRGSPRGPLVEEVSPDRVTFLRRGEPPEPPSRRYVAANPLDAWVTGDPEVTVTSVPPDPSAHAIVFAELRAQHSLDASTEVRALAWREHDQVVYRSDDEGETTRTVVRQSSVLVFAEETLDERARWILGIGHLDSGASRIDAMFTRVFMRRPRANDVYRFALEKGGIAPAVPPILPHRGAIDEDAWSALTATARDHRWRHPVVDVR